MSIYELENLLTDPDYFIEETFLPLQNEIDIIAEEAKLKRPENADEINKEREEHFKRLNEYWEKCKKVSIDGVFNEEIDKIRTFMSTFDSKEQNIQQKLEQNIKEMKLILLRFHSYHFEINENYGWLNVLAKVRSKIMFIFFFLLAR